MYIYIYIERERYRHIYIYIYIHVSLSLSLFITQQKGVEQKGVFANPPRKHAELFFRRLVSCM